MPTGRMCDCGVSRPRLANYGHALVRRVSGAGAGKRERTPLHGRAAYVKLQLMTLRGKLYEVGIMNTKHGVLYAVRPSLTTSTCRIIQSHVHVTEQNQSRAKSRETLWKRRSSETAKEKAG